MHAPDHEPPGDDPGCRRGGGRADRVRTVDDVDNARTGCRLRDDLLVV